MIDRRFHRSLHLFSWVACSAMAVKLVLFTEYGTRRRPVPAGVSVDEHRESPPHVFTEIQKYADRKLDEFFGVDALQKAQAEQQPPPPASDSHNKHE